MAIEIIVLANIGISNRMYIKIANLNWNKKDVIHPLIFIKDFIKECRPARILSKWRSFIGGNTPKQPLTIMNYCNNI